MSANKNLKNTIIQPLCANVQHDEYQLLSTTQVVIPEQRSIQQQGQENQTRRKKCRGNRKKQRYRRQLYNQGFDSEAVAKLVEEKFNPQVQQETNTETVEERDSHNIQVSIGSNQATKSPRNNINNNITTTMEMGTKRKRILLSPTPTTETISILDKPISQLSISQARAKKTKTTAAETKSILDQRFSQLSISQEDVKETKPTTATTTTAFVTDEISNGNNESTMNYLENLKPRYLKVSDRIFKRILVESIENGSKLIESLNTPEKVQIVREITEITNNLYHKDFQEKLWQEYYNISSQDMHWELKITKQFARQNSLHQIYRPKKSYIQQRLATIAKQKERIAKELQEHLAKLLNYVQHWQPPIDEYLLTNAIDQCVIHGQKRLKEEFQYKKEILKLDWNDHQLLKKFYELKPNEELIQLAQHLWEITADEQKTKEQQQILEQRIYLKRLPPKIDQMVDQLLDDDNRTILYNPFLDPDQRANFASRCSKIIIQSKFLLMTTLLDDFAIVTHRYNLTLTNLNDKLFSLNKENPHVYTSSLLNVIEERRQAMIQRFIRICSDGRQQLIQQNYRRSEPFIYTTISSSLPFIEKHIALDFNLIQMLNNARKYIPPCQSRFSHQPIKDIANTEYETVLSSVKKCLGENRMSITDQRATESFADLERIIHDLYCKRLPDKLYRRARREYKKVKRLQKLLSLSRTY
ncbi:unnamed protein product [Rotaria sordida]|uniref:Uncharacterized protein n=1 Tax=Rotaria sordida TaxID=392033 RepID=A0A815VFP2_9BILA|nr:unnamed protein product [Rotaria sordida]